MYVESVLKIINTVKKNKGESLINSIDESSHLRDDIGLGSLDLAELTVRIEAEYDIDVFDDGIVTTVGEIIEKLKK